MSDLERRLDAARSSLQQAEAKVRAKELSLGLAGKAKLQQLINSPFINARMNALAIKIRLRERLCARKFELDPVERVYRRQVNGLSYGNFSMSSTVIDFDIDQKVHDHTRSSVQKRDPSIQQLARDYNRLCDTMHRLIKERKAPHNAVVPEKIPTTGLFTLDVDDTIWQDIGLVDDEESSTPPLWLCDNNVRTGIKARLELDRCAEEESRLRHERHALRVWFAEEWNVISTAYKNTGIYLFYI